MKELSIEEKYKKALERAKEIIECSKSDTKEVRMVLSFFPELKESEDERIRKELVQFFEEKDEEDFEEWIPKAKVLAWLEKQVHVKESQISQHENEMCKENDDSLTNGNERIRKEMIFYFTEEIPQCSIQEHADKMKEFITWLEKQESVGEIVSRCKTSWYNEGKIAGMAEGLTDDEKYQQGWHDALEKQGEHDMGISEAAKKELGDNLHKALAKETPESWNEFLDEQKPTLDVEIPFGRDSELLEETMTIPDGCYAVIEGNKVVIRKGEQKPIIDNKNAEKAAEEYRNFRSSCGIKDPVMLNEIEEAYYEGAIRKQKTVEWSEEDEKMLNRAIQLISPENIHSDYGKYKQRIVNWLKSLKDRVQLQNKWINVDEEVYVKEPVLAQKKDKSDTFGGFVVCCDHTLAPNVYERYMILGNIVSQNTWKPSDEQIRPLEYAIDYFKKKKNDTTYLESLYQDLKKLREE